MKSHSSEFFLNEKTSRFQRPREADDAVAHLKKHCDSIPDSFDARDEGHLKVLGEKDNVDDEFIRGDEENIKLQVEAQVKHCAGIPQSHWQLNRDVPSDQDVKPILVEDLADALLSLPGDNQPEQKITRMKRVSEVANRLKRSPDAELTRYEVSLLYEIDHPVAGFRYQEYGPRVAELRALRGERDLPELAQILLEVLAAQARTAYDAYKEVAIQLIDTEVVSESVFYELLERKMADWERNGVIENLARELVQRDSKPNLVATPSVLANWTQIKELTKAFGNNQPRESFTNDDFLEQFSAEDLSGKPVIDPIKLSIIPTAFNMERGTVSQHREMLAAMQAADPHLGFRVPSMLEAVSYWYALRRRDGIRANLPATSLRHFDIPVSEHYSGNLCVPASYIFDFGEAHLTWSDVTAYDHARLSVG